MWLSSVVGFYLAVSRAQGISLLGFIWKVDVYAHFVLESYTQALKDAGHTPGPDGMPGIAVGIRDLVS